MEDLRLHGLIGGGEKKFAVGDFVLTQPVPNIRGESTVYSKILDYKLSYPGLYRIKFGLRAQSVSGTAYAQIYKNGIAYGTERSVYGNNNVAFTEDLLFSKDDNVQVYIKCTTAPSYPAWLTDFQICIEPLYTIIL